MVSRRQFNIGTLAIVAITTAGRARGANAEPSLWLVSRGAAKVYLFGFSDAKDRSWLTPRIERAFSESGALWLETPPPPGAATAEEISAAGPLSALMLGQGTDPQQSLFEAIGPALTARTLAVANELNVPRNQIEPLRPWLAYVIIDTAFRARSSTLAADVVPDQVLTQMAASTGKPIHSEWPTQADAMLFLTELPDQAQREHLEELIEYIENDKKGLKDYGWIAGATDDRKLQDMRKKRPALYEIMQSRRNKEWAKRIDGFLTAGGINFVAIGVNRMLGPDSIPNQLTQRKLPPRKV